MTKSTPQGMNDPFVQLAIRQLEQGVALTLDNMNDEFGDANISTAIMAVAVGDILGVLHSRINRHAQECDRCGKLYKNTDLHELFIKNFTAAFARGVADQERDYATTAAQADDQLEKIFRSHKK